MTNWTYRDCIKELKSMAYELEQIIISAIAHKKKLVYAASQFREFVTAFENKYKDVQHKITQEQLNGLKKINDLCNKYKQIVSQNMAHCWAHTAINSSSSSLAAEICEITQKLNEAAKAVDPELANIFDSSNPNWLQYHLFDLHAVAVSFKNHLDKHGDSLNEVAYQAINSRLLSIQNFCKEYENEKINTSSRVFTPIPIHYASWAIDPNDLVEKKVIGTGVSANVYYGIIKSTKQKVAIKKLKYAKLSGVRFRGYQREITVLATSIHPTLLKFYGATQDPPYRIVTEWMPGGNLYHELHNYHKLDNTGLSICAFDIARGMNFLHSKQIVHRDLKTLNVLLDSNKHAKICDFGFSRKLEKKAIMTKNVGTPHWMAPELLDKHESYDSKVDVYSYGIVLWEILTHKTPYQGMEPQQIINEVVMNDIRPPLLPQSCSQGLYKLITSCWDRNPNNRPTFEEILEKFKSGEIFYPDCDMNVFMKYVQEGLKEDAQEGFDINDFLNRASKEEVSLEEFIKILNSETIPNNCIQNCWDFLESNLSEDPGLIAKSYTAFLKTSKAKEASSKLRNLRNIPKDVILQFLQTIPTGNDLIDDDLIVSACSNDQAEEALICAFKGVHVRLALDMLSQTTIKPEYEGAVLARCMLTLSDEDDSLVICALKCLTKMGKTKMIAVSFLIRGITSQNEKLRKVTFGIISSMFAEGFDFSPKFINLLIDCSVNDQNANEPIGTICKNQKNAEVMLERFQNQFGDTPIETIITILKSTAEHKNLNKHWKKVLSKLKKNAPEQYKHAIKELEQL